MLFLADMRYVLINWSRSFTEADSYPEGGRPPSQTTVSLRHFIMFGLDKGDRLITWLAF